MQFHPAASGGSAIEPMSYLLLMPSPWMQGGQYLLLLHTDSRQVHAYLWSWSGQDYPEASPLAEKLIQACSHGPDSWDRTVSSRIFVLLPGGGSPLMATANTSNSPHHTREKLLCWLDRREEVSILVFVELAHDSVGSLDSMGILESRSGTLIAFTSVYI
jgi:hypothetical protein